MGKHKSRGALRWPERNATHVVPVYERPEKDSGESEEDFQKRMSEYERLSVLDVEVQLMARETVRAWALKWQRAVSEDAARLKTIKEKGEPEPMLGLTEQGMNELTRLQEEVVRESVVSVYGIWSGNTNLEEVTDKEELIRLLHHVEQLGAVAMAARRAQSPTPDEVKA